MTAALTVLPRKSEAEVARRRMCRVVIVEIDVGDGSEEVESWMEKAIVDE